VGEAVRRAAGAIAYGDGVSLLSAFAAILAAAAAGPGVLGHSVEGRAIRAQVVGDENAPVKVLVVGSVHGNERGGAEVVAKLRRMPPPHGVALWLVNDMNPDGTAADRRQNAHDVDLNRNFPYRWRAQDSPAGQYYSGPGPLSEPESRAAADLVKRIRPRVTVWYHQALRMVVKSSGDAKLERLYSARSGLPWRDLPNYHGTAVSWQNHAFRGDTAFVAELPGGRLGSAPASRHARALMALARAVAPPRSVSKPIPFGAKRKRETREYAQRHYGIDDYRLKKPKVIVEHYTATNSVSSVFNTFASDQPDVELHELPGVCSHYVIDSDGTIYRLVPTSIICRHTVGLNWTAIGIEHVGTSDGQVMGNRKQRRASLRLTRYLQGRFGIRTKNVIGHSESLSSPYHHERVKSLRKQTHGDFQHKTMNRYRKLLSRLPRPSSVR
jgi:N-acetylmuramoyl-L-alanine amidase-like protein/zinc carboxypeptidase